jgi:hypothetical protein
VKLLCDPWGDVGWRGSTEIPPPFNVERAIGARLASPVERADSGQLVPSLLQQLPRQTYVAQRIVELLGPA